MTESAATRRQTEYLVLERTGSLEEERYDVIGKSTAYNASQAVKAVVDERDLPEESTTELFVAVPLSNWTPIGRSIELLDPVVKYVVNPTIDTIPRAVEGLHAVEPEQEPVAEPGAVEPNEEEQTG